MLSFVRNPGGVTHPFNALFSCDSKHAQDFSELVGRSHEKNCKSSRHAVTKEYGPMLCVRRF